MKFVLSLAAVLALMASLNLLAVDPADAGCRRWRCGGAVIVPAPNPIPLRPVVTPCGGCAAPVVAAPACVGGCDTAYYYDAYWAQPGYVAGCSSGPGNCYWRRDCWYDSFGRRFCN
jgi:hypothetical protein